MSAVILPFPSNARACSERLRTVRDRIIERANATKATPEKKAYAIKVAMDAMDKGASAGWAIYLGQRELPRLANESLRSPTDPRPAA